MKKKQKSRQNSMQKLLNGKVVGFDNLTEHNKFQELMFSLGIVWRASGRRTIDIYSYNVIIHGYYMLRTENNSTISFKKLKTLVNTTILIKYII
jgi:hypothetical protein